MDSAVAKAESAQLSLRDLRQRAMDAVMFWLDLSRHERDEASGVFMARYLRETDWQTIDTMPTDGTRVLVTNGLHVEIRSQRKTGCGGRGGQPIGDHGISWDHWPRPMYWMPLPVPPETE